jgi:hypothetical protein
MRIAVIALSEKRNEKLNRILHGFAGEFRAMGHSCDTMTSPVGGLSGYDFLVFCSDYDIYRERKKLGELLVRAGSLGGKRSMAVLSKGTFFSNRNLGRLMSLLEKEGLVVTMAELISGEAEVPSLARGAPLVRG